MSGHDWIKQQLRAICAPPVYNALAHAWASYVAFKYRQHRRRFGDENPGRTFYVIRRLPPGAGLFSNVWYVMSHVNIAKAKGWIPVVDMERYATFYTEPVELHQTRNAWEYYFKQPSEYALRDVYRSADVVVSGTGRVVPDLAYSDFSGDLSGLSQFIRANVALAPHAQEQLTRVRRDLFPAGAHVLGVFSRGSDYTVLKPAGHWKQPELTDLIATTRDKVRAWKPDKIFVTTEEKGVVDTFATAFPGMVVTTDRFLISDYDGVTLVPQIRTQRANGRYLSGLEYLIDIYLLASCDYYLGALTNGSRFALALNGGQYKEKCIIDLGVYE